MSTSILDDATRARVEAFRAEVQGNANLVAELFTPAGADTLASHGLTVDQLTAYIDERYLAVIEQLKNHPEQLQAMAVPIRAAELLMSQGLTAGEIQNYTERHTPPDAGVKVEVKFYGISIQLSHDTVERLIHPETARDEIVRLFNAVVGTDADSPFSKILRWLLDNGKAAIDLLPDDVGSMFVKVLTFKSEELASVDKWGGYHGVWIPITWPQLLTLPEPPMAAAWIHPVPMFAS